MWNGAGPGSGSRPDSGSGSHPESGSGSHYDSGSDSHRDSGSSSLTPPLFVFNPLDARFGFSPYCLNVRGK